MTTYAIAWALSATVAAFIVLAVIVGLEIRDHRATQEPAPVPAPRIPEQRQPTAAAVVVEVTDPGTFDDFLAELIITPHIEAMLR